jgi:hypothetical protein
MTIEAGQYEMRGGGVATITDTGCFAYGRRDGTEDLWQLDGTHVPLRPAPPSPRGHSKFDLVRRLACDPHDWHTGCARTIVCQRCHCCLAHCTCPPPELRAIDPDTLQYERRKHWMRPEWFRAEWAL